MYRSRIPLSKRIILVAVLMAGTTPVSSEETAHGGTPQTTLKVPAPEPPRGTSAEASPIRSVLAMAVDGYKRVRAEVDDYTCVVVRRERVDGKLGPHEFIYGKVRHRRTQNGRVVVPFSVYLKFLKPRTVAGRELLYVEGKNNGEIWARRGGTRFAFVTMKLDPNGDLAMRGNRHPITEFGVEKLLYRLAESARRDLFAPCDVEYLQDASINGVPATGVVVTQKYPSENHDYYQARIFVDKDKGLPIHYETYGWPKSPGELPELLEQYTYTNLNLNVGLTDADFSEDNPQYQVK